MKKIALLSILLLLTACSHDKEPETITVSAAASLKNALSDIEKNYEATHYIDIQFNYGASGSLANQIKSGAPVDLFFSAASSKVDDLIKAGRVKRANQKTVLENQLVLISQTELKNLDNLKQSNIRKIALGTPETVPAGAYGKEALTNASLWNQLKNKIVYTKDVRQALTYVESGNAEAGVVYKTDVTPKLKQLKLADNLHRPITYPLAIIKESKEARDFYNYLQSDAAKKVYQSYGFTVK